MDPNELKNVYGRYKKYNLTLTAKNIRTGLKIKEISQKKMFPSDFALLGDKVYKSIIITL